MLRSTVGKVMWVGRATVFLVGLAVILALVFGVASTALGANGKPFLLGKRNAASAISTLIKQGPGPALSLVVRSGQPPLVVNASAGKATNLNADKVDGKSSENFYASGSKVADSDKLDSLDSSDFAVANHQHTTVVRRNQRILSPGEVVFEFVKMCQPGEIATGGGGGIIDAQNRGNTFGGGMGGSIGTAPTNGEVWRSFPMKIVEGTALPAGEGDTPRAWAISVVNEANVSRSAEVWAVCQS